MNKIYSKYAVTRDTRKQWKTTGGQFKKQQSYSNVVKSGNNREEDL